MLEAENNHILQQFDPSLGTQQTQSANAHPTGDQNLVDRPYGIASLLQSTTKAGPDALLITQKPIQDQYTPEVRRVPAPRDRWQRPPEIKGWLTGGPSAYHP